MKKTQKKETGKERTLKKKLLKAAGIAAGVYAGLFTVFYFDLDGKAVYYGVIPFLKEHYDNGVERNDNTLKEYAQMMSVEADYQPSFKSRAVAVQDGAFEGIDVPKPKRVKVTM